MVGQADDLGGGVYKKRLSNNQYRSIILARGGDYWVCEFLYAKQDMANIADVDLKRLRTIASGYGSLTDAQVAEMLVDGEWIEICTGDMDG